MLDTSGDGGETGRIDTENTPDQPLTVGDPAPEFRLPGVCDEGVREFRLSEYTQRGAVVLAFYPFDFGPAWSGSGFGLRDVELLTFTKDVDVLGVSVDGLHAHRRFREEQRLNFPLLTDRFARVADRFGVTQERLDDHQAVPRRAIFAIDDTGTIRHVWQGDDPVADPTPEEIQACTAWLP
jgi:peroxiredoxin